MDENLNEALDSCLAALIPNSKIMAINTLSEYPLVTSQNNKIEEIHSFGATYTQALSIGLSHTESAYVAIMNSDDLVHTDRFTKQILELELKDADLCITRLQKFSRTRRNIPSVLGESPLTPYSGLLLLGSYGANASWCFTREWAKKVNLFDSSTDTSDWTTALRVFPNTKIVTQDETLYFYRMHKTQITRTGNVDDSILLEKWKEYCALFGLPVLADNQIRQILFPARFSDVREIDHISRWLDDLEKLLLEESSPNDKNRIRRLVTRRKLLIKLFSRKLDFKFNELPELLRLGTDTIRALKYLRY